MNTPVRKDIAVRPTIKRSTLNEAPHELWNTYVDLLSMSDYQALSEDQRPAYLVFWYDSEVNNGGHLQYFENQGTTHLDETIEALGMLGAEDHQRVLIRAKEIYASQVREPIETVEDYIDEALEGEFSDLDRTFYKIEPELTEFLEKHLDENIDHFVEIIEDA